MLDLFLTLFYALFGLTLHPTPKAVVKPAAVKLDGAVQARLMRRYGDLPLSFEANRGQADPRVKFVARGRGYTMFFGSRGLTLGLTGSSRGKRGVTTTRLGMQLVQANPAPQVSGVDPLPGKSNYFIGNDPGRWRTDVPTYRKVRYTNVYPGVDLIYYGNQRQLEYDFVVAPQADPARLRLSLDGAGRMAVDAAGDLVVETDGGEVRFHKPVVYQPSQDSGTRNRDPESLARVRWLDGRYVLKGNHEIGFAVTAYDRRSPLVIDPVLTYSTYLGGNGGDAGQGIAVDAAGNAYVTGSTASLNFPTSTPFQKSNGGGSDVFVAKLNPAGTALVYATYLGGSGDDSGAAIALDSAHNAYVTGNTASPNFPTTTGVFQASYGGSTDAFVTELNAAGAALVYSSYLGGGGADFGQGIAVDSAMNAYVTGSTQSTDFPTVKPLQGGNGGAADVFVAKVNPSGSALVYSTYLGGNGADSGQGIAVDILGNAYVAGSTASANFPISTLLQPSNGGGADGFVAKLNPAGSALVYSTYLGGSGQDRVLALALDPSGDAYVAGDTTSLNFPATAGAYQTANNGNADAFISKLNPAGSALLYSTLLGGSDLDSASGIAVDAGGNTYVTGLTRSNNFPVVRPSQTSLGGGACGANVCPDAFVAELNPQGASLVYSTYLGGSGADGGQGIALGPGGNAYVTGSTASPNFTAIAGAFQGTYGGIGTSGNAFVTAINAADAPGLAVTPQPVNFGNQALGITSAAQAITVTNAGSAPLNIATVTANGDFVQTNTCVGTLAAGGGTCTISATFTPAAMGARTGDITLTDNAAGSPQLIPLSGTGVTATPAVTLTPTSLTFPDLAVGATSAAQTVTLNNTGQASLNITGITISGDFTQTNNCPASLARAASCTISVLFKPTATGTRTGSVSIADNATPSPQTVSLTGTGTAVFSLSSAATSATILIGTTSTTFTVAASAPSSFTSAITLSCEAGVTCSFSPASIMRGQSSTATVSGLSGTSSNPTNLIVDGSVGTSGSAGQQTAKLYLGIFFQDFSVTASPVLGTVASSGQSTTYTVSVASTNGFNQPVTLSCPTALLPAGVTCTFNPASVTPTGSVAATSTMTVKTTMFSALMLAPPWRPHGTLPSSPRPKGTMWPLFCWALVLLVGWATRRYAARAESWKPGRALVSFLPLATVILLAALATACQDYGTGPLGGTVGTGTPAGNYVISITGTLGSNNTVTRSVAVNLSVG